MVGAPTGENGAGVAKGVATVFLRSGTSWREDVSFSLEQAKADDLVTFPTAFDGTRVVVGAIRDDTQANNAGSAYVNRLDQLPAPVIPEVPYAALVPLAALGMGALATKSRWASRA